MNWQRYVPVHQDSQADSNISQEATWMYNKPRNALVFRRPNPDHPTFVHHVLVSVTKALGLAIKFDNDFIRHVLLRWAKPMNPVAPPSEVPLSFRDCDLGIWGARLQ
jgi:hypothetical protein